MKKQIETKYKFFLNVYGVAQSYNPSYISLNSALEQLEKSRLWVLKQKNDSKQVTGPYSFDNLTEHSIEIILKSLNPNRVAEDISIFKMTKSTILFFYKTADSHGNSRDCVEFWKYKFYS